jgi:hypothetical protein
MINLSICCLGFSGNPGFITDANYFTQFLKAGDTIVNTFQDCNTIIIGDFLRIDEMAEIVSRNVGQKASIMFVGEPRNRFPFSQISDLMWNASAYHAAYGCVSGVRPNWIKYPLYVSLCTEEAFIRTNTYVQTCEPIQGKRFAALINRHDPGNTRIKIYNEITQMGLQVDCPGDFMNNCSNEELNRIGKPEWLKQYLFNICFENFTDVQPGYISEKLMDACLSGTIPIYNGTLDAVDERIFNKERILFYNSADYGKKMDWLMASNANYTEFYRQPVFMPTAWETIQQMKANVANMFDGCRDIVAKIQHQLADQGDNTSPVKDE